MIFILYSTAASIQSHTYTSYAKPNWRTSYHIEFENAALQNLESKTVMASTAIIMVSIGIPEVWRSPPIHAYQKRNQKRMTERLTIINYFVGGQPGVTSALSLLLVLCLPG